MLIFNLFFYHNSIVAEQLFDKISSSVFSDENTENIDMEKLNIILKEKILSVETNEKIPIQIRDRLKTHYLIWSGDGPERQLADDLFNEEFFMSNLCEYRASKYLLALLNSIRERAELDEFISI